MTQIVTALGEIAAFKVGDVVRVAVRAPIGHYRVPTYLRGKRGVVARVLQPTAVDNEVEGFGHNAGSCYPRPVLGLPPDWYKQKPYRARAISEPRKVLAEFGTIVPDNVSVRVGDSTAMMRFMVLPRRPEGNGKL